ncbi:MAG: glycine betaine ABC transporter substrate-binding protein [Acidimicrobiia bacterium]
MRGMKERFKLRGLGALVLGLSLVAAACNDDGDGGGLTVAAANFPESNILAQVYGQALEAGDVDVSVEEDFGTRPALLDGLEDGSVDLTPEYVGALLNELEGPDTATSDLQESVDALDSALEEVDLVGFEPSDAQDVDALAVTQDTADELGIETYTDLAGVAGDLTLGAPAECAEFPACIPGLRDTYGIEFGDFVPLEAGPPIFDALDNGDIDVARVFSTDAAIAENGWVVLEDDQGLNPVQNVIPVGNEDADTEEIADIVNEVSAALTTEELTELNRRVVIDVEDPEDVAADWLEENDLS